MSPRFTGGAWVFGDMAGCDLVVRRGRDQERASLAAAASPGLPPALTASLTSSTFSSSTVGSSTIPGITAAAPTLIRCSQPRSLSPSIPLWVSQVVLYHLRMRLQRRAGALPCRCRSRRVYAISGSQAWLRGGASFELRPHLLVVIVTLRALKLFCLARL